LPCSLALIGVDAFGFRRSFHALRVYAFPITNGVRAPEPLCRRSI
jgi:hypothetical protein